jgi:acyl-CoA thioesterase
MTTELDLARRCAEAMYAEDLASQKAGIVIEGVAPGRATARMKITETMINGHEICHGGYIFLLSDTAFAFACNTYGQATVAQDCDIVFVRPAHLGDELVATATERVRFGRNGIYDVTVRSGDKVVAEFRGKSRTIGGPSIPAGGTSDQEEQA